MSLQRFLFIIFTLSGFSGLIYESIWTHYLKLFLGHAAWAQTIVLAIFMGGMALGAWICSRYGQRWPALLRGYAMAEAAIGIMALGFHAVFSTFTQISYDSVIPMLGSGAVVDLYKWLASGLIILPQSVLLGMTFPLMSGGLVRRCPQSPGDSLSMLYFTNSIGAAVGILVAGFVLLDQFGLPGTMQTAGLINLLLATAVWWRVRDNDPAVTTTSDQDRASGSDWTRLLLTAALLTGLASFIYEIAWIRMLSLVLSSSTHSFELMLSAFILGLALGGLWIRRRVDRLQAPLLFLARVQIVMGLLAFATLILYGQSFSLMAWLMQALPRDDQGYLLFNLAGSAIAMAIMVPVTFCAGMTLPLITLILYRRGEGERAIGRVYSANTAGGIIGVMLAVHIGMPLFGLKGLLAAGAIVDIALGLVLWWRWQQSQQAAVPGAATGGIIVAALLLFVVTDMDRYAMASGVYRSGSLLDPSQFEILLQRDGKAASVSLTRGPDHVTGIRTNGKVDASIYHGPLDIHTSDEATMVLAAALPLLYRPDAVSAANIGMGSGLTTHSLMYSEHLQQVDTIEIEAFMVEAARVFGERVEKAWSDPRSAIHIDDAKTFFASHGRQYDFIISEPSNPWVSGTASLFTTEFYRHVSRYLRPNGILVQWLQLYEIDLELVASVIRALSAEFPHYVIYSPNDTDILILATRDQPLAMPGALGDIPTDLRTPLASVGINTMTDLQARYLGSRHALQPLFLHYDVPANSDYYPYLDLHAARSRFLGQQAVDLIRLREQANLLLPLLEGDAPTIGGTASGPVPYLRESSRYATAGAIIAALTGTGTQADSLPEPMRSVTDSARPLLETCLTPPRFDDWLQTLVTPLNAIPLYYQPPALQRLLDQAWQRPCEEHDEHHRRWMELWHALSSHDNRRVAALIRDIIDDPQTHRDEVPMLAMVGFAALTGIDDKEGAAAMWQRLEQTGVRPDSLAMRFLAAHRAAQ